MMSQMNLAAFHQRYGTAKHTKRSHSGRQVDFTPTKRQVDTAATRIRCMLERKNFTMIVESFDDTVAACCKHVHNRGNELGDRKNGEFKLVVIAALERLIDEKIVEVDVAQGTFKLVRKPQRRKRSYAKRRPAYVAA